MKFVSPYRFVVTICIVSVLYIPQILLDQTNVNSLVINIQSVSASTTYGEGSVAGKAQGHSDAINGNVADDSCGLGHSNDYCLGYKAAYNAEYWWTKLVQDRGTTSSSPTTTADESEYMTCSEWYEEMKKSSFLDYSKQPEFNEFKNKCSYLFTGNNSSN